MKKLFVFLAMIFCSFSSLRSQTVDTVEVIRVVDSLLQVSSKLVREKDFEKALEFNAKALKLTLDNLGEQSSSYANTQLYRGGIFRRVGNYLAAEKHFLKAIEVSEILFGKENERYGKMLYHLAILYMYMNQYEKSEPLNLEAKSIFEKTVGKEHRDYQGCLINLAATYWYMGDLAKVEPLYIEKKDIVEKLYGREHLSYAGSLSDLAGLYSQIGLIEKSELYYLEAIAIHEKTPEKELNPDYALLIGNLGVLYYNMGNYEKAEPLYIKSKALKEKLFGKENPDYLADIMNLSVLYNAMGNFEKAEPLMLDVIKKFEVDLDNRDHPFYKRAIHNLGILYYWKGDYEKAEPFLIQFKNMMETEIGKENLDWVDVLKELGKLYWTLEKYDKAAPFFTEMSKVSQRLTIRTMLYLSEEEMNLYLYKYSAYQNLLLSFCQLSKFKEPIQAAFNNSLFFKGFLLNSANQLKQLSFLDSLNSKKFNLLKSYSARLADVYSSPIVDRDSLEVADLRDKINSLDKDLSRTVTGFGDAMRQVEFKEVQTTLDSSEAAIEFVRYQFHNLKWTTNFLYAALILRSGDHQPQFIPLFEEKTLQELLKKETTRRAEYVNNLYLNSEESLYDFIWKPLEKELKDVKTIHYSPSGLLHQINLGAIPINENEAEILSDRFQLRLLNSTRELVIKPKDKPHNSSVALFGGIKYEADGMATLETKSETYNDISGSRGILEFSQTDSTLRGDRIWEYLPSTQEEIEALSTILKKENRSIISQKGFEATEESFKALSKNKEKPSPNIIHIATHGYFFPDPEVVDGGLQTVDGDEPVFKLSDHPMIRSGLLFAGANHAWQYGKPIQPNMEDGILTAYEISQLDLSDTELVVLSACETGLGDIQGNEGVYGLQRAFKIAGVNNIMMSLWQVPDYHTKELMVRFYKNWLEEEMEVRTALLAAQNSMREEGYEPFHWAGFVVLE